MKNDHTHSMKRSKFFAGLGSYAILVIAAVIVLIPILWMVSTSIKIESETITIPPKWIPDHPTLESYRRLWSEYPFLSHRIWSYPFPV